MNAFSLPKTWMPSSLCAPPNEEIETGNASQNEQLGGAEQASRNDDMIMREQSATLMVKLHMFREIFVRSGLNP